MGALLMAKSPNGTIPKEFMEKAREMALAKKARMIAEAELGISDDKMPVIKGPPIEEKADPEVEVYVNLPEFQDRIVLDSVHYMHGRSYTVSQRKAAVFKEQMARAWRHQAEIEGKDRSNWYLQQQRLNTAISLGSGQRHTLPPALAAKVA
jgi:hypothetical protein